MFSRIYSFSWRVKKTVGKSTRLITNLRQVSFQHAKKDVIKVEIDYLGIFWKDSTRFSSAFFYVENLATFFF